MNPKLVPLMAAGLLALAACSSNENAAAPAPVAEVSPAVEAPVVAPAATQAEQAMARNDPAVVNFEGFGPAKFGADEEQVRMAWGHPLEAGTPAEGASCYLLWMDPRPEDGKGITFLFEEGKFARYDVSVPAHVAPGDLAVGARAEEVRARFAGRVEEVPAKYVEGGTSLIVSPEDGGATRLIFEVDAQGVVTSWHIGVPPQVYYVEGCG